MCRKKEQESLNVAARLHSITACLKLPASTILLVQHLLCLTPLTYPLNCGAVDWLMPRCIRLLMVCRHITATLKSFILTQSAWAVETRGRSPVMVKLFAGRGRLKHGSSPAAAGRTSGGGAVCRWAAGTHIIYHNTLWALTHTHTGRKVTTLHQSVNSWM